MPQSTWKVLVKMGCVSPQNIMRAGADAAAAAASSENPELSGLTGDHILRCQGVNPLDVTLPSPAFFPNLSISHLHRLRPQPRAVSHILLDNVTRAMSLDSILLLAHAPTPFDSPFTS